MSSFFTTDLFIGTIREFLIALDAIQLFICIQLSSLFFWRAWKDKRTWKVNAGWGLVFVFFGFVIVLKILEVFYVNPAEWNPIFLKFRGVIPFISVIALLEYFIQKYRKTKYIFTIMGLILGSLNFFVNPSIGVYLMGIYMVCLAIFAILFFGKLISLSSGTVRMNVILFTISFVMLFIGWTFTTRIAIENQLASGWDIGLIGIIARTVQMSAFILMAVILMRLPIFFEVNWRENLIQMFIIHKLKGIPLFHHTFREIDDPTEGISEDLIAGGMVGITTMLKEISRSTEDVKIIDHGDLKILLEHGSDNFIALLVKEEMFIHWDKLNRLQVTFEKLFGTIIKSWDGNLDYFEPLKNIIAEEFQ